MRTVETTAQDWQEGTHSSPGLQQSRGIEDVLSRLADQVTQGRKAIPFTEAAIAAGLVEDKTQLRQITEQNESVLNRYFEQLDMQAVADRLNVGGTIQEHGKEIGKTLALIAVGAVGVKVIDSFKS